MSQDAQNPGSYFFANDKTFLISNLSSNQKHGEEDKNPVHHPHTDKLGGKI